MKSDLALQTTYGLGVVALSRVSAHPGQTMIMIKSDSLDLVEETHSDWEAV